MGRYVTVNPQVAPTVWQQKNDVCFGMLREKRKLCCSYEKRLNNVFFVSKAGSEPSHPRGVGGCAWRPQRGTVGGTENTAGAPVFADTLSHQVF